MSLRDLTPPESDYGQNFLLVHQIFLLILQENRLGEVWEYQADVSKAERLLNYAPAVDIEAGLQKTTEWYESRLNLSTI